MTVYNMYNWLYSIKNCILIQIICKQIYLIHRWDANRWPLWVSGPGSNGSDAVLFYLLWSEPSMIFINHDGGHLYLSRAHNFRSREIRLGFAFSHIEVWFLHGCSVEVYDNTKNSTKNVWRHAITWYSEVTIRHCWYEVKLVTIVEGDQKVPFQ